MAPRLRRLTEPTSPRAAFELLGRYELLNVTSPSYGIERNSSSPLTAAVAADALVEQGMVPFVSGADQFAALMKAEAARFGTVIRTANIRIEP